MAEFRNTPSDMMIYILACFNISHFKYNETDIYYRNVSKPFKGYMEYEVRVDVPETELNGDVIYFLEDVTIRCAFDVYAQQANFIEAPKNIIIAGLKKKGYL